MNEEIKKNEYILRSKGIAAKLCFIRRITCSVLFQKNNVLIKAILFLLPGYIPSSSITGWAVGETQTVSVPGAVFCLPFLPQRPPVTPTHSPVQPDGGRAEARLTGLPTSGKSMCGIISVHQCVTDQVPMLHPAKRNAGSYPKATKYAWVP